MLVIIAVYAIVPSMYYFGPFLCKISNLPLRQLDIQIDPANGHNISMGPIPLQVVDDLHFWELLEKSEAWFEKLLMLADGLGVNCCSDGPHLVPHNYIFQLKSNIIQLRIRFMAKKSFILFVTPFLVHFHIFYSCY